jgi:ribosomal-protein-alanine N-acetyltransferase
MSGFITRDGRDLSLLNLSIAGERVRLVPTTHDHAEAIFREFSEEITRYMYPRPAARMEETLDFIERSRERMAAGANLQLTILSRETGEFLGCCGLHGESNPKSPELGIWVKRAAHGRGYGREAIVALVRWASDNLVVDHILYPVDRNNLASRKIPESLGGTIVAEKSDVGHGGNPLDLVIYRLEPLPAG